MISSVKPSAPSIDLGSCAAFDRIVATTGSSVYEVIVLRGEPANVLVRGGKHFTTFCPVLFVGSMRPNGAIERDTIEIGLRMKFYFEEIVVVTSAVRSLCRHSATAATACCAATT
jgi:hypothetical protein